MLSWIRLESTAYGSKRVRRLAAALSIERMEAWGRFCFALTWVAQNAESGDVSWCDELDLAEAFGYDVPPVSSFRELLLSIGFLESTDDGRTIVHDWEEYQGYGLRERQRQRARRRRDQDRRAERAEQAPQIDDRGDTGQDGERTAVRTRGVRVHDAERTRAHRGHDAGAPRTDRGSNERTNDRSRERPPRGGGAGGGGARRDAAPVTRDALLREIDRARGSGNPQLARTVAEVAAAYFADDAAIARALESLASTPARDPPPKAFA